MPVGTRFIQTVSDIDKKMSPLINILIRTHRPELLPRCIQSVIDSGYDNWLIWLHADNWDSFQASLKLTLSKDEEGNYNSKCCTLGYNPTDPEEYHYNLYCNKLMAMPEDGFFLFLDDDDTLIPGALSKIAPHLEPDRPVICQMLRNGRPKPADIYMDKHAVIKGRIGMPCMIIHSKHKNLYTFKATEDTDYEWIKTVSETLDCKFVKIPVVDAGKRSHGL
jgi:hypothetical protein